jgi:hypothetical protein
MRRWRGRGESGQSLVEFAMVLPLLLVILFAIIDFGRIYQANVSLTNAVREGARLGAVGGTTAEVQARVRDTASGLSPTVSVTPAARAGDSVVVNATATVPLITPLGSLLSLIGGGSMSSSFTLNATANMRLE